MKTYATRLQMIQELPTGTVGAEVGVYRGIFSGQVLELPNIAHLWLIDPWIKQENYNDTINAENQEAHYQETRRNVQTHIDDGRCTIIRDFSAPVAKNSKLLPVLDFAFIDAYHAYESALEDLTLWSKRVKQDGVLFAHDYFEGGKKGQEGHTWYSGVVKACADFCSAEGWQITGVTTEDLPTAKLERKK